MASTPLGQSGPFFELYTKPNRFSKHRLTIYEAIAQGLRVDVDLIRESMDEESFRQEFLCEFVDESTAYFPYDIILSGVGRFAGGTGSVYIGIDIGRRRDLTVVYVLQSVGSGYGTKRVEVMKNQPYEAQKKVIRQVWKESGALRGAIDSTGIGNQLSEELAHELNLECVTFTNDWKEQAAVRVKRRFESRSMQIPDDKDLISDIHGIKRTVTSAGNIRFDADRTDAGHSDRFWALALAVHAAEKPYATVRVY
jgi:phage FluMu gp28-like protein